MKVDYPIAKEKSEHSALIKWISYHPILKDLAVHIPNEGKRHPILGANLKRLGMRKGVSDIFIPYPTSSYHGLWIELKREKKYRIEKEQKEWIDKMNELGYYATFAFGWIEAKNIIEFYLVGKRFTKE